MIPSPVLYPDEAFISEFRLNTIPSVVPPVKLPTILTEVRASFTNLLNNRLYLFFSLLSIICCYFLESMGLLRTTDWLYPVNISYVSSSENKSSTSSISSTFGKKSSSIYSNIGVIKLSLGVRFWPFLMISYFYILTISLTVRKFTNVLISFVVVFSLCLLSFRSNRASLSDLNIGWCKECWKWFAEEYVW